jgi:predicted RNA polymerase sigma factor
MGSVSPATTCSTPPRADLLRGLRHHEEAAKAYETAASLAPTAAERDFLVGQAQLMSGP